MVYALEHAGFASVGVVLPYLSEYVLGTAGYTSAFLLAFVLSTLLSIPVWLRLTRRYGRQRAWIAGLLLKGIGFGAFFLVPGAGVTWILVVCIVIGSGQGCGSVAAPSLQGDVIDWDARRTGERKEGAYFAAWNLAMKGASAAAIAVTGIALDLAGFVPGVEQPAEVVSAIQFLAGGLPSLLLVGAILLLLGFRLDPGPQEGRLSHLPGGARFDA